MYKLYYYPGNASLTPHILLQEMDLPHELVFLDRAKQAHKAADYRKLNPHGLIPTLIDDGEAARRPDGTSLVLTETAAICLHLVDAHPEAGLAPPPDTAGTAGRANFYRWLFHLTNTPQAVFVLYFYPERYADDDAGKAAVRAGAETRLNGVFDVIEAELADKPFLLGERYSLCDIYLFMMCRWGRRMTRPPRSLPNLARTLAAVAARPAVRRTMEAEGFSDPYY